MAEILDARVKQKTGTAAEFAGYTLLEGEIALVRTSSSGPVFNFKVGPGNFDSLDWSLQNPGAAVAANTSTEFPSDVPGLYIPTENGTYEGVTVDLSAGYTQLIWDGTNMVKVVFPINDKDSITPPYAVTDIQSNKTYVVAAAPDGSPWPPEPVKPEQVKVAKNFPFGIVDDRGIILQMQAQDGSPWPPYIGKAPQPPVIKDEDSQIDPYDHISSYVPAHRIIPNGIENQWIYPTCDTDNDGNVYVASIGNARAYAPLEGGEIWLTKITTDGRQIRKLAGRIREVHPTQPSGSDDHNCPCVLIDKSPDAPYPIILFQAEHEFADLRMCRLTSFDPEDWDFTWTSINDESTTYTQAHYTNVPGEILLFMRTPQYGSSPNQRRAIRWMRSTDYGSTWTTRDVFALNGEIWLYGVSRRKDDGSGINIGIYTHPIHGQNQGIYFLHLDFATGELRAPGTPTPVVSNFRTVIFGSGWTAINPYTNSLQIYFPSGTNRRRLWDIGTSPSGECLAIYQMVPSSNVTMDVFIAGETRVVSFDITTGAINYDVVVGDTGLPCERPVGNNLYFAGAAIINNDRVLFNAFKNVSMLTGGNAVALNEGRTYCHVVDITDEDNPIDRVYLVSANKVMRPFVSPDKSVLTYIDAWRYLSMYQFTTNKIVEYLNELI